MLYRSEASLVLFRISSVLLEVGFKVLGFIRGGHIRISPDIVLILAFLVNKPHVKRYTGYRSIRLFLKVSTHGSLFR